MMDILQLEAFLSYPGVTLDVRSPGEFVQGHIPQSSNLPLFSNDERARVGMVYKQQGKDLALELGLEITGPKLKHFVASAKEIVGNVSTKVYCWRGGMRSSSLAWLLQLAGIKTSILKGGYKTFRRWALNFLQQLSYSPLHFVILGGLTGSGKTSILHLLKSHGEQVLDLEGLASHRGSSYGMLGMSPQPSNEHFENSIAYELKSFNPAKLIWMEDESRMIGKCKIPNDLFNRMQGSPLLLIQKSWGERLSRLQDDYCHFDKTLLLEATHRLNKKLGGEVTKKVISHIKSHQISEALPFVLKYYDTSYLHTLSKRRGPIIKLEEGIRSEEEWAQNLLQKGKACYPLVI